MNDFANQKPFSFSLRLGLGFIVASAVAIGGLYMYSRDTLGNAWSQFGLVLGFIAGITLITIGLHSTGYIKKDELDRTTLALAIAAITFSIWQFRDARMEEARMEGLSDQLSTKFVGFFPKDLKVINSMLDQTQRKLDIMADFAGYGHYSARLDFKDYLRKLEDLRSKNSIPIRLLVYTTAQGTRAHNKQFTEKNFNDDLKDAQKNSDSRLKRFVDDCHGGVLPTSKAEFDSLLFQMQRQYLQTLQQHGVQIRITDNEFPFFLWNEDDDEAVFAFLNEDQPGAREASFYTRDSRLVLDTLQVRFCKYWNEAHEVEITDSAWAPKAVNTDNEVCKPEKRK